MTPLLWAWLGVASAQEAPLPWPLLRRYRARDLDCERIEPTPGSQRYPGLIDPPRPRGDLRSRDVLVCRQRLLRDGLREPGAEALLHTLQTRVAEAASHAATASPTLRDRTWLVEAHLASPAVGTKVRFAAINALMARGLTVSDRVPLWSAGDLYALADVPDADRMANACARLQARGALGPDEVLLGLAQIDPRETGLHAGVCADGRWAWLP